MEMLDAIARIVAEAPAETRMIFEGWLVAAAFQLLKWISAIASRYNWDIAPLDLLHSWAKLLAVAVVCFLWAYATTGPPFSVEMWSAAFTRFASAVAGYEVWKHWLSTNAPKG